MINKLKSGSVQVIIIGLFVATSFFLSKILENDSSQNQNYISSENSVRLRVSENKYHSTIELLEESIQNSFLSMISRPFFGIDIGLERRYLLL